MKSTLSLLLLATFIFSLALPAIAVEESTAPETRSYNADRRGGQDGRQGRTSDNLEQRDEMRDERQAAHSAGNPEEMCEAREGIREDRAESRKDRQGDSQNNTRQGRRGDNRGQRAATNS